MLECGRLVVYSLVESAPPCYAFGLFALDFSNAGLAWIAAITYGYKIAPPNLAATMAAIVNAMQFVLGEFAFAGKIQVMMEPLLTFIYHIYNIHNNNNIHNNPYTQISPGFICFQVSYFLFDHCFISNAICLQIFFNM
jgi:hypothetical protein